MPIGTLHHGIPVDFADVLLIINVFAIAMLLGVLYIDEIINGGKRLIRALNPLGWYARFRFWRTAARTPQ